VHNVAHLQRADILAVAHIAISAVLDEESEDVDVAPLRRNHTARGTVAQARLGVGALLEKVLDNLQMPALASTEEEGFVVVCRQKNNRVGVSPFSSCVHVAVGTFRKNVLDGVELASSCRSVQSPCVLILSDLATVFLHVARQLVQLPFCSVVHENQVLIANVLVTTPPVRQLALPRAIASLAALGAFFEAISVAAALSAANREQFVIWTHGRLGSISCSLMEVLQFLLVVPAS